MIKLELPYVTVLVDDRFRNRLARAGERLRVTLTAYLRNAADDLDGLGRKATVACQTARGAGRHGHGRGQRPHRPGARSRKAASEGRLT